MLWFSVGSPWTAADSIIILVSLIFELVKKIAVLRLDPLSAFSDQIVPVEQCYFCGLS
jgi:hypothetical protein